MSKLKIFNLEEALAGKPVVFRTGQPVTELLYSKSRKSLNKRGLLSVSSDGSVETHHDNGMVVGPNHIHSSDLFMATQKKTVWVNMWRSNGQICTCGRTFESEEKAKKMELSINRDYLGTHPIEIEL